MKKALFIVNLLIMQSFTQVTIAEVDTTRQNELRYFVKHDCGSCHGMTLKGGLGPALLPKRLSAMPKSYLVNTILEGRPNTAMPAWKSMLTVDDASWIAEQLQHGQLLYKSQHGLIQPSQLAQNKKNQDKKTQNKKTMGKP